MNYDIQLKMHLRPEISLFNNIKNNNINNNITKHTKSFFTRNISSSTQLLLWDTTTLLGV